MGRLAAGCLIGLFGIGWLGPRGLKAQTLQQIRQEITRLEQALKAKEAEERSLLDRLEDLSREITLRQKLLDRLDVERQKKEREIQASLKALQSAQEEFEMRRRAVAARMVAMYKRGSYSDLEVLLTLKTINQALVWYTYQQRILAHHRRNLRRMSEKKEEIEALTRRLIREREEKEALIAEAKREKETLESRRKEQEGLLQRLRTDKDLIVRQIEEKKKAYAQVEKRIAEEEARRKVPTETEKRDREGFTRLKGRLPWPVKGRITEPYGRRRHPISKTWYENLGVEITTSPNALVRSVASGRVIHVDWIRGRGNVVLLDHGGYYTVYGQLARVEVAPGDYLNQGDLIGQVGDSQSLYGSTLHFEIWEGTRHQDPAKWLE